MKNNHLTPGILSSLVREIIGEGWNISPLTEISRFIELKGFHFCNLYIYLFSDEKVIDKAHHRIALYDTDIVNVSVESQLRKALSDMREKITFQKAQYQHVFFE